MKSLIVDDVLLIRKFLIRILSEYGHCDSVEDGHKALSFHSEAFQKREPYQLLCLDIMMPNLDGLQVLKRIRNFEQSHHIGANDKIKIIMITSMKELSYVNRALEFGCDDYVVKPIETDLLIQKLKHLKLID